MHVSMLPPKPPAIRAANSIEQSSLCWTVGPCWLSIINPAVRTSYCFYAEITVPNAQSSSLHLGFATEGASVFGMLGDFSFHYHFP